MNIDLTRVVLFSQQYLTITPKTTKFFSSGLYLLQLIIPDTVLLGTDISTQIFAENPIQILETASISVTFPIIPAPPVVPTPKVAKKVGGVKENDESPKFEIPETFAKKEGLLVVKPQILYLKNKDSLSVSNIKLSSPNLNTLSDLTFQIKFLNENFLASERMVFRLFAQVFPSGQGNTDTVAE